LKAPGLEWFQLERYTFAIPSLFLAFFFALLSTLLYSFYNSNERIESIVKRRSGKKQANK